MRKITFLKSLLLLCALMAGVGSVWGAEKWVKTAPEDLETGDIVVIVDLATSKAMSNNGGTSSAPSATEVALNDDKDEITSEVAATLQWEVTISEGSYKFGVAETSNYLYCTNTNNGVRVGTNANNAFTWEQDVSTDSQNKETYYLKNTATSRFLGVYNSTGWRCYGTVNANIKACVTAFYKKTTSSDPSKTDVTLTFPEASYEADIAEGTTSFSAPTATATPSVTGIIYMSSNTDVATVNENTGAVTLVKKGTTQITASFPGDDTYNSAEASYTLTVNNSNANDGSKSKPFTVEEAIENTPASGTSDNYYIKGIVSAFYGDDIVSDGTNYRYYISDDGTTTNQLLVYRGKGLNNVAFSDADDLLIGDDVVILGGLTTYSSTKEIASGNYIYSLTRKAAPTLVVDNVEMYVEQEKALTDLYLIDDDYAGTVTFSSSDNKVATIAGDKLQAVAVGTATITVSATADAKYKAVSETFTVTVKSREVAPEGAGAGASYVLVTDGTSLAAGDKIIVVCESKGKVMGEYSSGTYCPDVAATIDTDKHIITELPDGACVITLESTEEKWYLNTSKGYLVSSAAKSLKATESVEGASAVTISVSDNNAAIGFGEEIGTLQYNASSPRFCTYTSNQTAVQIYRYTETTTFDIEMGAAGWRTLVSAHDVTLPEGLTAYVVTANDGGSATLATAGSVKANTPYILKGDEGTYTLTMALGVTAPASNLLQISDESTGNGVYVLYNGTQGVGFYKWYGGSLGAGRVYLPATAGAPEFIALGGETTGIDTVKGSGFKVQDSEIYNLAGQRVARPTKGLYIVNGKKVVIR